MKNRFWIRCQYITFICLLLFTTHTFAQNSSLNQSNVKKIAEGIYLITGLGCNITAVDGAEGLLVIDTGLKPGKLDSVLSTISNHPVKYILNTNFHNDHVVANKLLCDKGATIIAHKKTRDVLTTGYTITISGDPKLPIYPPETAKYLPKICFIDTLNLYINDNTIQAIHYPNAHSCSDAIFYFKNRNLIHVGDILVLYGFPYIDATNGGTLAGLIRTVDEILKLCDDKTILIAGHGKSRSFDGNISNRQGLQEYQVMLVEANKVITNLVNEGKTLDEIIKLDPLRKLLKDRKSRYENEFIKIAYSELTKK